MSSRQQSQWPLLASSLTSAITVNTGAGCYNEYSNYPVGTFSGGGRIECVILVLMRPNHRGAQLVERTTTRKTETKTKLCISLKIGRKLEKSLWKSHRKNTYATSKA